MVNVSICIPSYKDTEGMRRLLNSIREQSYTDYDVFVTDDTSDDSVEKVVCEFRSGIYLSGTTARLSYIHNDTPLGPAGNWNKCISMADGAYVKIMHQDDFFTFEYSLAEFVKLLDSDRKMALAFSGSRQIKISSKEGKICQDSFDRAITEEQNKLISADWHNLFLGGFIGAPSAVIYRNVPKLFDKELSWLIDGDFYMNLLKDGGGFAYTKEPLVSICESDSQLTNSCISNGELVLREHKYLFAKYNLYNTYAYRQKLIQVCLEYGFKYSDICECSIPKAEYIKEKRKKNTYLMKFYIRLVLRKLHIYHG